MWYTYITSWMVVIFGSRHTDLSHMGNVLLVKLVYMLNWELYIICDVTVKHGYKFIYSIYYKSFNKWTNKYIHKYMLSTNGASIVLL